MRIQILDPYHQQIYFGAFDDEHDFISASRVIKSHIEKQDMKGVRENQKQNRNPIIEFIEI